MKENEVRRQATSVILEKEALEDIALMHAYAAKLEKQDKGRHTVK
jgi:hypothetical protein